MKETASVVPHGVADPARGESVAPPPRGSLAGGACPRRAARAQVRYCPKATRAFIRETLGLPFAAPGSDGCFAHYRPVRCARTRTARRSRGCCGMARDPRPGCTRARVELGRTSQSRHTIEPTRPPSARQRRAGLASGPPGTARGAGIPGATAQPRARRSRGRRPRRRWAGRRRATRRSRSARRISPTAPAPARRWTRRTGTRARTARPRARAPARATRRPQRRSGRRSR